MAWQTVNHIAQALVGIGFLIAFAGCICGFVAVGMKYYQGGF